MNRENAINNIVDAKDSDYFKDVVEGVIDAMRDDCEVKMGDIIEDYESRTCSNCKHFVEVILGEGVCYKVPMDSNVCWRVIGSFGCRNKFERKTDDD